MFYIRPFGAWTSTHLSGELVSVLAPIISSIAPMFGGSSEDVDVLDMDASKVAPMLALGASTISGDKVERMMKKLLATHNNITIEQEGRKPELLTADIADEFFAGNIDGMFILAWEVINANYSGFFERLAAQFGVRLQDTVLGQITASTEG